MNYTEKYHLPQWEESDRVMRRDFNQMCADIEQGLGENAQAASAAQSEAAKLPYVVGSYTGTGSGTQDIIVGFKPSIVLIFTEQTASSLGLAGGYFSGFGREVSSNKVEMIDNGFRVSAPVGDRDSFPSVNNRSYPYQYIAFR